MLLKLGKHQSTVTSQGRALLIDASRAAVLAWTLSSSCNVDWPSRRLSLTARVEGTLAEPE